MSKIKEILDMLSADDDFDDALTELLKPETLRREESQEMFETFLGYDPITYYDRKDIEFYIDEVIGNKAVPENVSKLVEEHRNELIEKAFDKLEEVRDDHIMDVTYDTIASVVCKYIYEDDESEWNVLRNTIMSVFNGTDNDED